MLHTIARKTSFGYRFAMIHRLNVSLAREGLKEIGLTQAQMPFLMELLLDPAPKTQKDLAQALVIDPAATARNLEQLEKNGWIHRKVNPKNRRQKLVFPSQKAREHEDKLIFVLKEASQSLVSDFSEKEKRTVLTFLDRIMANGLEAKGGIKE